MCFSESLSLKLFPTGTNLTKEHFVKYLNEDLRCESQYFTVTNSILSVKIRIDLI